MGADPTAPRPGDAVQPQEIGRLFGLPIVASKLAIPPLPDRYTPRPRVVAALSGDPRPICLVQAPAGYGKTVAVVEALAREDPADVAWLSVDAYDSTELAFWAHLAASIDLARPGVLRRVAESNVRTPEHGGVRLAASVLAALPSGDELLIVLDDLHHLESRTLWEQLSFFLERTPPGVRVIATTRAVTQLPVERWQSQRRATVVDQRVLRFDTPEAKSLISGVSGRTVTASDVADLVGRTEGWAVGLLFEALTWDKPAATDPDPRSNGTPKPARTVISYLASEVFDTLTDEDRRFLLSISVLDEFDDDLCRRVTGEGDAGLRLRSLQVANLFLVPVGDEPGRFRFHHLFRELLLEELDRRDPGRRVDLHRRAAEAAAARGEVTVQIHHLLEADEKSAAFGLMVGHAARVGSLATARELIASFPNDFVLEDPRRMLEFALVHSYAGDWDMAEQWCDRVESTLTDGTGLLRARLELHRAWSYGGRGETQAALAALECSLDAGSRDGSLGAHAIASMVRLHVLLTRDRQSASFWIDEARRLPQEFHILHHGTIPGMDSFLRLWDGDTRDAERLARQVLLTADQMQVPPGLAGLEALLALTDVLIETGRLSEAAPALERAETLAGQIAPPAYLVHAAIRRIELTAATEGPAAGADAAAHARAGFKNHRLGVTLTDALTQEHGYWLLAEGRAIEAARLAKTLAPSPSRSILNARLDTLDHQGESIAGILGDTEDWPASERLEAELILDAADGYTALPVIIEQADGFVWTVVKQGQPLLRRLASLSPDHPNSAIARVLDNVNGFNAAFRPAETAGSGSRLSDREMTLLRLLPSHLSYAEIAAELFLSVNTVKANLKTLYRKLGATSRSEAVQRARSRELV